MRKHYVTTILAACVVAAGAAGSASAGEIRPAKPAAAKPADWNLTPVHFHLAASICSFSGINDAYVDPEKYQEAPDDTAHTQTPAGAGGRVVGSACNGSPGGK